MPVYPPRPFRTSKSACRIPPQDDKNHPGLALQQIATYRRTGDPLPASFTVPIVREERRPKLVASYGSTKVAEFAATEKGHRRRG